MSNDDGRRIDALTQRVKDLESIVTKQALDFGKRIARLEQSSHTQLPGEIEP
jgi:hypothetical protein